MKQDSHKKTLIKTIIWRTIATLITLITAYIVTGDTTLAVSVGSLDFIAKTIGYYIYERLWQREKQNEKD